MAENKDKKVLNVPNKREITPNELGSAEHKEVRLKRNVPNLRFKEFSGEWEECRVSDLLDFYSTNSLSWDKLEYKSNNIMNLHYGLIHVGLPTMVDLSKDKLPTIIDNYVPRNYQLCKEGDIVFADASEDTNEVAKAIEFYSLNGKNVVCGLHTIHGRDNNKTVVGFKGYAFASTSFHHQIRRIAQGTKVFSISTKNFSECYIGIPTKDEQRKIADFLRLLDERIATQNKIFEELKQLKNGISDKLFKSIKGAVKPLSSICEIIKGKQINGEFLTDKGEYYVMNGGVKPSGYFDNYNVEADTISISEGGSCGYVQFNTSPFWSGGHCYTIQEVTSTIDNLYLYHYLKSKEDEIMKLRIGTGLPNIQKKDLANFKIVIPEMEKQKKISNILSLLERKIENSKALLSCLQAQKQHLLRHMFI